MNGVFYLSGVALATVILIGYLNFGKANKKALKTKGTADDVVRYFIKKGLTKFQAVGIAGNLRAESNFKAYATGDNGSAYGIAQWRGIRLKRLKEFASDKDVNYKDFNTQIDFIWHELNTTEGKALTKLKQANSVDQAAINFAKYYERPATSTYGKRVRYAEEIFESLN